MADDPVNQQKFAEDVAAAAAAAGSGGDAYADLGNPDGPMKLPSVDEVWKIIEQMDDISEEERASIKKNLYNPEDGSIEDFLKRYSEPTVSHTTRDYMIFFAMIAIIVLVFALFGYKLYKSLKEKELKKQGKSKAKQSKKSKKSN